MLDLKLEKMMITGFLANRNFRIAINLWYQFFLSTDINFPSIIAPQLFSSIILFGGSIVQNKYIDVTIYE